MTHPAKSNPERSVPRSSGRRESNRILRAGFILLAGLLLTISAAAAQGLFPQWAVNGVPIKPLPSNAGTAVPVVDGEGGVFVVWQDRDPGAAMDDVRVQHLRSDGSRDLAWPLGGLVVGPYAGQSFSAPDGAGGIYVTVAGSSDVRVQRVNRDGSINSAWAAGGGVSVGNFLANALTVDRQGGLWALSAFGDGGCIPDYPGHCYNWTDFKVIRVDAQGAYLTGWEPPGRQILRVNSNMVTMGGLGSRPTAEGVALGFRWTTLDHGENRFAGVFYVYASGTGGLAGVSLGNFGVGAYDGDDLGNDFVQYGEYSSGLQRLRSGVTWPVGWAYPIPGPIFPDGVVADNAGGAYARTAFYGFEPFFHTVDRRLNHVLPNGVSDPLWPAAGVSYAGAGASFQDGLRSIQDGRGGCFMTWQDSRNGSDADIYAFRFARDGSLPSEWPITGKPICVLPGVEQSRPYAAADAAGNLFVAWRDARQGVMNVYAQKLSTDVPVPTQVQRATARLVEGTVELTWELADAPDAGLAVERSLEGESWAVIGSPVRAPARDQWRFVDEHPRAGAEHVYRLNERETGWTGGEVTLSVPVAGGFELTGPWPNPVTSASRVTLNAVTSAPIELVVTDLLGRQVARRNVVDARAGAQTIAWDGLTRLPCGCYWLSASQQGAARHVRFMVTR